MPTVVSVLALSTATRALLDAHATLTVYQGIVDPAPPVDEDQVVKGYAVFHPTPGNETSSNLAVEPGQLLWSFQVTCAGGDTDYCMWAVDAVRGQLAGKTLTVAGAKVGIIQPPLGYNPPLRQTPTDAVSPRVSVPLQYQVLAVPA